MASEVQAAVQTPLPWKITLPLYINVMSDAVALTLFLPLLPDLCELKYGLSAKNTGFAVGILAGVLPLARTFSASYLGHLSDLYGRKIVLLGGGFTACIALPMLATVPYFIVGALVLFFFGLTNSNNSVSKAALGDITDSSNRGIAFAYQGAAFMLARTLSSAVAGMTFGVGFGVGWMESNPFLMPTVLGVGFQALAISTVICLLPETNKYVVEKRSGRAKISVEEVELEEKELSERETGEARDVPAPVDKEGPPPPERDRSMRAGLRIIFSDHDIVRLFGCSCIVAFCNGGFLAGLVLFLKLERSRAGIGASTKVVGVMFMTFSLVAFIFQVVIFKPVSQRLGLKKTFLLGCSLLSIGCAGICAIPLVSALITTLTSSNDMALICELPMMAVFLGLCGCGFMTCLPVLNAMTANGSDPEILGLTQGTAQSCMSFSRSVGPFLCGAIFSVGASFHMGWLLFVVLLVGYMISGFLSLGLSSVVESGRQRPGPAAYEAVNTRPATHSA